MQTEGPIRDGSTFIEAPAQKRAVRAQPRSVVICRGMESRRPLFLFLLLKRKKNSINTELRRQTFVSL